MYVNIFKSVLDISLSVVFLVIASPIIILLIFIIYFSDVKGIFFIQGRPGKGGVIFNLIKFKTMNDKTDKNGQPLPDSERLTKVGNFIRKLSLDELLQFINVIKGDMSLIGPRPLMIEYLPLYNDFHKKRHNVKPGITGWAQVNGRNELSWKQRLDMDVWYVENISFRLDVKIFIMTIIKILKREGISSNTSATMEKFKGNLE